ncbi:MAG: SIMPL domain-containing protein [Deltaproteobacteria bacterium]|jgi:uncharacterized protein YggE|nr:SIMPL domain-containing protein [Deltaproteobacteria bacterium]
MKLIALILAMLAATPALAEPLRYITIKGTAESEAPPDFVKIFASILADHRHADRAKQDVDSRMKRVVDAIAGFEIDTGDMSFSGANVNRTFESDKYDNETFTGYHVYRTLEVKLRNLAHYEQFIHALVTAGVDEIGEPESDLDDKNPLKAAALGAAAQNAKRKAEIVAKALEIQLGDPIEIGEDRLFPGKSFEQSLASRDNIEEILITGEKGGISDPLLFVPENIKVWATVWIRFELLTD